MRPAIVIGAAGFLVVLSACRGGEADEPSGEPLTLDAYVEEFQRLTDEVDGKSDELEDEFNFNPDEGPSQEFIEAEAKIIRDFAGYLGELQPPPEVSGEHDEVVGVFEELATAWESGNDGGEEIESRFHQACAALETAVAEQGIEAELCADPEQARTPG